MNSSLLNVLIGDKGCLDVGHQKHDLEEYIVIHGFSSSFVPGCLEMNNCSMPDSSTKIFLSFIQQKLE